MNHSTTPSITPPRTYDKPSRLIIIGGGPVGIHLANNLATQNHLFSIKVFSNEDAAPYNRARLSQLLAGQIDRNVLDISLNKTDHTSLINCAITDVNCDEKTVTDDSKTKHHYDILVFATGARAHVPDLPGKDLNGVYQFRSLRNTENLLARKVKSRHVVVVGGGLLGIETAVAMNRFHTNVSLVHQGSNLLDRQLDEVASVKLQDTLVKQGISVFLSNGVRAIEGNDKVEHVSLRDGLEVKCDTVILCCGSSPNIELARDSKIRVNHGIVVTDLLETSEQDVFAIGECCEHSEKTYGLVGPGYEQADVLADRLVGGKAIYVGSDPDNLLKVLDLPLRSFGTPINYRKTPFSRETTYRSDDLYIKIVTNKSKIIGGILLGEIDEMEAILDHYQRNETLGWVSRSLLKITGKIWPFSDQNDPGLWNEQRVVCRCQQINVGNINHAIKSGSNSLADLGNSVRAGVTCGSCQPLLAQLIEAKTGKKNKLVADPLWRTSLTLSILGIIAIGLMVFIPGLSVSDSVTAKPLFESIWNDKFWKQVSGFSLLGVSIVGLLVSLKKRFKNIALGDFLYWRFAHIALGVLCALGLMVHTGLHLGSNLNRWLVINFIILLTLGALTSATIALRHRLSSHKQRLVQKGWNWLHILAAWPLPALLAAHIMTVYKF